MCFDSASGFLWLGTEGGLVRYDGVSVKSFTTQNLPQMTTSRIYGLYKTTEDRLLAVGRNGGTVIEIHRDNAAVIPGLKLDWLNAMDRVVRNLQTLEGERKNVSEKIADSTPDFLSLLWINDTLCLTSSPTYVYLFDRGKKAAEWKKKKPGGTAFFLQGKDVYILHEDGSAYAVDINNGYQLTPISARQDIFRKKNVQLFQFDGEIPLLFSGNQVYRLHFSRDRVQVTFLAELTDCPDHVISMVYDPTNEQIFCGTLNNGLYIFKRSPFYTYEFDKSHGDTGPYTRAQLNDIYASAMINDSELITNAASLNLNTGSFRLLKDPLYYSFIATDGKHVFGWIGENSKGVLTEFNLPGFDGHRSFPALRNIRLVFTDSKDRVWLSGDYYLSRLAGDSIIPYLDTASYSEPFTSYGFEYVVETHGKGLIGANGFGICMIDTITRKCRTLYQNTRNNIRSPYVDQEGLCWIPTYGDGILMYDLNENKLYKPSISNVNELIFSHCFIDDGAGNFFIATNNGLFRINRRALIAACKDPKTPLIYQYFDVSNSLKANEFNGGCTPAYNRMANGDILLPSLNGLVRLSPALLTESQAYPLFIQSVASGRAVYPWSPSMKFASDERYLTYEINFGQWDYTNFFGLYYRVDGAAEWSFLPPGERKIPLTELSGGYHVLEVKKQFDLAGKRVSTISVDFYIGLKLYERKITWLLAGLFFLAFIWLIAYLINLRLTIKNIHLEERVREKTTEVVAKNLDLEDALSKLNDAFEQLEKQGHFQRRLIALISHDIMIPLKYISKVSAQLVTYNEKLSKKSTTEAIGEINTTAIGLTYLGENIIQWIRLQEETFEVKASRFSLNQLVEGLLVLHRHLADEKGNRIEAEIQEEMLCYHDPVIVRVILHNLLLNANKFTSEGVVGIRIFWKDTDICMIISDTGTGISPDKLARLNDLQPVSSKTGTHEEYGWGLGYRLIIDLLRLCQGSVHIESQVGQGTAVTIVLPPLVANK
jgi:signal transduction histidine kinase